MWYLVAGFCGLAGALSLLRGLELIFFAPSAAAFVQLAVGSVLLFVAWKAVQKARLARQK